MLLMMQILPYLKDPKTMGIVVYSFLWMMQDVYLLPGHGKPLDP